MNKEAEALGYATRLSELFVAEHFPHNPDWRPLPELIGVLTQLDNAITIARDYKEQLRAYGVTAPAQAQSIRDVLANAIDSPTVGALADVFGKNAKLTKSYSEQIVDILLPRLASLVSSTEPYDHAFVEEIKRADAAPPEAEFSNVEEMLEHLNGPSNRAAPPSVALEASETVAIRRSWLEDVIKTLQGPLPSGHIGDVVFLLRDQLQDALTRPQPGGEQ